MPLPLSRAIPVGLIFALSLIAADCQPHVAPPGLQRPASAPNLLAPLAGVEIEVVLPSFTWEAVADAAYYLITVTQDGGVARGVVINDTSFTPALPLTPGAGYSWKVAAGNDAGLGPETSNRRFSINASPRPSAPVLTDAGGRAVPNRGTVIDNSARLHWRTALPLARDDSYELEVAFSDGVPLNTWRLPPGTVDDRVFTLTLADSDQGSSRFDVGIDCGQTYRWRVRVLRYRAVPSTPANSAASAAETAVAYDHGLAVSAGSLWSQTWTFSVQPRPSGAPSLIAPAEGARITTGRLEWHALASARAPVWYEYVLLTSPTDQAGQSSLTMRPDETASVPLDIGSTPPAGLLGFDLIPGQTYYWRVRASYNPALCFGPWSALRSFVWAGTRQFSRESLFPAPDVCTTPGCPTASPGPSPTRTRVPTRTPRPTATPVTIFLPPLATSSGAGTSPPTATVAPTSAPPTATDSPTPTDTSVPKATDTKVPEATATDTPKPTDTPIPEEPTKTVVPKDTPKP